MARKALRQREKHAQLKVELLAKAGVSSCEPCGPSDAEPDPDERPADIRGQHVTEQQWADVQDVPGVGEWL